MMNASNKKILIVGGGPAGSTAASLLAMKGFDVTLFEKEKFPRPHVGESLLPFNYSLFDELGVLDRMTPVYNRKPGVKFSSFDGGNSTVWYFKDIIDGPGSLSFHVERASFDKMLLDRSRELGVTVCEETAVRDISFTKSGEPVIVVVENKNGEKQKFTGDFIIDASGQSTFLAKKMKNKTKYEDLDRVALNAHWSDPMYDKELEEGCVEIIHLGGERKGWIWAIPLHATRVSIGVVISSDFYKNQKKKYKSDKNTIDKVYREELDKSPLIKDVLKQSKKETKTMVNGDYSYFCEKKYGQNYAIIGDASAFLDPIFSSGIYVSMASAKMVSEQLSRAFEDQKSPISNLQKVYKDINGGYALLEKLIRIFYDPNALALSNLSRIKDEDYEKFQNAYKIYHYILQGDFFENYEKYMNDIEILRDSDRLEKYTNLVKSMRKKPSPSN